MRMCDHPNVLSCYASFVHGNELWLVMEFMSKGSCLHVMNVAKKEVPSILLPKRKYTNLCSYSSLFARICTCFYYIFIVGFFFSRSAPIAFQFR